MSKYIKIEIETSSKEQLEILIAELSEINFEAFEENENSLSAFIREECFNENDLKEIILANDVSYTKSIIVNTNWNAKWESEFEPIIIEDFVAVRAAFHEPIANVKYDIIITPKMSFGTGHHATTYLMLQQMQNINFSGKTVLDFGTGTGILAIMAKKLGAQKILAIDNDEWSINNAKENLAANNCSDIFLIQKDNLSGLEKFDIVLVNINLNVIISSIDQLKDNTHNSSQLLVSGFLFKDKKVLTESFSDAGFKLIALSKKNEWLSMLLTKL